MAQTETQTAAPETTADATENNEATAAAAEAAESAAGNTETAAAENTEKTEAVSEITETAETAETVEAAPEEPEEISYHAVEKEGQVAAIWEMQGRKHLRTIDPRSSEGKNILSLFTSEHHDEEAA